MTDRVVEPVTVKEACRLVAQWHRRHPSIRGAMWAVALVEVNEGEREHVAVATVGLPKARMLMDGARRLEVTRVAVADGVPSGCSQLYGACARAARAMGAVDLLTYTHLDEPAITMKASGWIHDGHVTSADADWSRPSRSRRKPETDGPKKRWWAPWSAWLHKQEKAA